MVRPARNGPGRNLDARHPHHTTETTLTVSGPQPCVRPPPPPATTGSTWPSSVATRSTCTSASPTPRSSPTALRSTTSPSGRTGQPHQPHRAYDLATLDPDRPTRPNTPQDFLQDHKIRR